LVDQVFVVMQFGEKALDSAYEIIIKPLVSEFGLKALRIDEIQDSGKITDQILSEIARSRLVFCDLSGERPNCYYEAGFAHALGKEIVFAVRKDDAVHFDLAGYRFIVWETELELRDELKKRLVALRERSVL
jgi:nucleoside 2-deoxyribosyltransferase